MKKLLTKSYEPVGDSVWVQVEIPKPDRIVLPGNAKLPPFLEAEVLAVGPKCVQVKKGDTVLLNAVTIMPIKVDGEEFTFTKEDRIVAISRNPFGGVQDP
jgi:co-chaperonin GroES (HSP10)